MQSLGVGLMAAGVSEWFWPGYNGAFLKASHFTPGEGQILAAVLFIGGAILFSLNKGKSSNQ